jgi:arginyl-tRNA--protein-N-Asp/Glu arginylyltransferase
MARLLRHLITGPEGCHYLPGTPMTTESRVMVEVSPRELEELLELGWRRFGPVYFRPICTGCTECVSVRVPVEPFVPSANMKRVLQRAKSLRIEIERPTVDDLRLELHSRWHRSREGSRGWDTSDLDRESYALQFCFPHPSAREFSYWEGDQLVAIGITDQTPNALSAVYCYYAPEHSELSLGTLNVLTALAYAKQQELAHVYLGYRVEACESLRYKGRFLPQERLRGRLEPGDPPRWELLTE